MGRWICAAAGTLKTRLVPGAASVRIVSTALFLLSAIPGAANRMDAKTVVDTITAVEIRPRHFSFRVQVSCSGETFTIRVNARQLLDFDSFQAAALRQTGRLVMPPCCEGAEGPDHYRRVRGNWCRELRNARWSEQPLAAASADQLPAGALPAEQSIGSGTAGHSVPAPKGLGKFARKSG